MYEHTQARHFKRSIITWIACLMVCLCCVSSNGQEKDSDDSDEKETPERYMVVLTIGEQEAMALRRDGQLRATLPNRYQNRVDSVLLKHPTTFLSKKLVIDDDVDKLGRTLLVNVDESVVDRLEYQPVQMKVYQSGFDSITIKYQRPRKGSRLASIRRGAKPKPNDSPQVFVRLSAQNGTTGWVRDMKSLTVETLFGPTKIPLNRIAGIRFNTDESDEVVIISVTGDYLSGKIKQQEIILATRWGDERIPLSKLESITYHRNARFIEGDSNLGQRWVLTQPAQSAQPRLEPARFPVNPTYRGLPNRSF